MATTYANQAVTIDQVLDSMAILLAAASGLRDRNVVEWSGDERKMVDVPSPAIWFRWIDESIDAESGAGRHGMKNEALIEVIPSVRQFKDGAMRSKSITRTHLALRYLIVNAVAGRMLHDAYDAAVGTEPPMPSTGANLISQTGTMKIAKLPATDRPRPEQGYVETRIGVVVPCVLKVTLNDVPAAE